jgi:Uma2 family endonuclease
MGAARQYNQDAPSVPLGVDPTPCGGDLSSSGNEGSRPSTRSDTVRWPLVCETHRGVGRALAHLRRSRLLSGVACGSLTAFCSHGAVPAIRRWAGGTLSDVRTVILDPPTAGLEDLLERRRRSGLDRLDEVWEGELHMVPAPSGEHADIAQQLAEVLGPLARAAGLVATMGDFNLGDSEHDYRVPDGGVHRDRPRGVWHPTAALVVEIISPGDETWEKLPFYASHQVDEVLIVDAAERKVHWLVLEQSEYQPVERSALIDLSPAGLAERIDWPTV